MSGFLAAVWSRRGLNAATFLLAVLAVAVAMVGPLYARASVEHLLDQRMAERPAFTVGLSLSAPALRPGELPRGRGAVGQQVPPPDAVLSGPARDISDEAIPDFWQPATRWLLDEGGRLRRGANAFGTALYWREGMCRLAQVSGRCPSAPGEALMDERMARKLGIAAGDPFRLDFTEQWLAQDDGSLVQRSAQVAREFTIVGTYRIEDPDDPAWFQPARFQGDPLLRPLTGSVRAAQLTAPALLVGPSSMTSQTYVAGADRAVDQTAVDLAAMDEVQAAVEDFRSRSVSELNEADLSEIDVASLFDQVRSEQRLLSRVTLAAVVPLVVLALLLLHVLVSAAADARRPQVALAKLRGFSPRGVLRFAVTEPFLVVLSAVPVAVVAAYVVTGLLARGWLGGDVAVRLTPLALGAAAAVTASAMATSAVALVGVVREPLAAALATSIRKRSGSRWALVGASGVVTLAVAALVQVYGSRGDRSTTVLELLAPLFVGLAVAVVGIGLLGLLARAWTARTGARGRPATFLAARRLLRRRDMARLMVPLLLSVSVTAFAFSAWQVADDWRVSSARAEVGAPVTYQTTVDPARLLRVTHQVDPDGRSLAAAVVDTGRAEESGRVLLVDSSRFARVAAWDDGWASMTVREAQDLLVPPATGTEPRTFSGRFLSLTLRDVRVRARLHAPVELWVRYTRGDTGSQSQALLGRLPDSGGTVRGFVSGCRRPCVLEQIYLSGSGSSITDATGELTITSAAVDGTPLDWRLSDPLAWRPARPYPVGGGVPVTLSAGGAGLAVRVELGSTGAGAAPTSGIVRIAPTDVAAVPPVLVTSGTRIRPLPGGAAGPGRLVAGSSLLGAPTPMREVGVAKALPAVGDEGAVTDLRVALREYGDAAVSASGTQLWVAAGTPQSVVDEVRAAGVDLTARRTVAGELDALRSDAFSLGWKVFLLVGGLTVLLAILGVVAGAVVQTRWRTYEMAALRVVGVRRRDLVWSSVLEYAAMLGCAVVLGAAAAVVALRVVLPSIDIGEAGDYAPAADYAIRWPVVGLVAGVVLVAVLLIAATISARTARLARPSRLRQGEPA